MNLDFPGLKASFHPEIIVLQSERSLHTLASAVVGGGLTNTRFIVNRHVDKNYDHPDPASDLRIFVKNHGIDEPFVGMMTAAYLDGVQTVTAREQKLAVTTVVTAGLTNPTSAGQSPPVVLRPGTINIILLIDAHLTPAAMVNAVITATESKTDTLQQRDVFTPEGYPATGTSTDAIVVACTGRGNPLSYAGPATPIGWLIGQGVRRALAQVLATSK